jgi:hypothetical protein
MNVVTFQMAAKGNKTSHTLVKLVLFNKQLKFVIKIFDNSVGEHFNPNNTPHGGPSDSPLKRVFNTFLNNEKLAMLM